MLARMRRLGGALAREVGDWRLGERWRALGRFAP